MDTTELLQYNLQRALFDNVNDYIKNNNDTNLLDITNQIGIAIGCHLFNALSNSGLSKEDNLLIFNECVSILNSIIPKIYDKLLDPDDSVKYMRKEIL